jgi:hypothetical protein
VQSRQLSEVKAATTRFAAGGGRNSLMALAGIGGRQPSPYINKAPMVWVSPHHSALAADMVSLFYNFRVPE